MQKVIPAILLSVLVSVSGILEAQSPDLPSLPSGLRVRADNRFFDIQPRIVPADRQSTVEIIPRFEHVRFKPDCRYELTYTPVEQIAVRSGWKPKVKEPVTPENGRIRISKFFEAEQEHTLSTGGSSDG